MNYLREHILEPIIIPLVSVALIAFGALNMSRLFLASASAGRAVIVATAMSAAILGVAAWASSRDHIDRGVLFGGAAMVGLVLSGAGLLAQQVDGDHQKHPPGGPPVESSISIEASDFAFTPAAKTTAGPGIEVLLTSEGNHTFTVEGHETEANVAAANGSASAVIELDPGDYVFFCAVAGHRDAGMEGTLTVTAGGGGSEEAGEVGAPRDGGEAEPAADESGEAKGNDAGAQATADDSGGGASAAAPLRVVAADVDFPTKEFQGAAGTVAFEYVNQDTFVHTLVVDGREDDMRIEAAGEETKKGSLDLEPGTYTLYCDIPGHREAGMEGTLTVT